MDEEKNNEKKDENIEGSLMEKCETYKNGINDKNHIYDKNELSCSNKNDRSFK